ncbi:MAG: hypothetical protein ACI39R_07355 [Lachnospiraceae bacterium]
MKKRNVFLIVCFLSCLVLVACSSETKEEKNVEKKENNVEIGRYYQDGNTENPFLEILSEDLIDVSNADIELMVEALEEIRSVDFPDDTLEERNSYLKNAREVLSTPYVFEVTQKGDVIKIRIVEFDGEFLAVTMEYNPVDNLIVWGEREFILEQ